MKQVRLRPGILMRFVDKDMTGDLLEALIDVIGQQCDQMFPLPPSPASIAQTMPGSGWFSICSIDLKTSIIVAKYDPGTFARFIIYGLKHDTLFVVYRVETGRIPLDSLLPNVTLEDMAEVVVPAVELPASAAQLSAAEFQAAAESLFKLQSHQRRSISENWTPEQLNKLRIAVEKYGRRWKLIASKFDFGEFTSHDLCSKWNELLNCNQVSGRPGKAEKASRNADVLRCKAIPQLTTREASLLLKCVAEHGQNWALIAQQYDFNGRDRNDLGRMWKQLQNCQDENARLTQ